MTVVQVKKTLEIFKAGKGLLYEKSNPTPSEGDGSQSLNLCTGVHTVK